MTDTPQLDATPAKQGRARHVPFFATMLGGLLALVGIAAIIVSGAQPEEQLEAIYRPLCAVWVAALVLWCLLYGWIRGPLGWRLALPLLLLTYLGIERFATPYLAGSLELRHYQALQDPDHRPRDTAREEGWNSDSLRCPHEAEQFEEAGTNLIFLGDSFTFGMKLEPQECFPQVVEDNLRARYAGKDIKVANFGWISSSPLLSWRRLKEIGTKYKPDLVVLCVDMTDIRDDLRWQAMLDRDGVYWYIAHFPLAMGAVQYFSPKTFRSLFHKLHPGIPRKRFFMSEAPLEDTRPMFAEIRKNIGRIETWCKEHGAQLAVVILPRTYQYSERESPKNWEANQYTRLGPYSLEPFRYFEELGREVDYPIYSLLETFQKSQVFPTAFEDDPHWNPAGARIAADGISDFVIQQFQRLGLP